MEAKPYQSNALHANELGLGLCKLGLGKAKSRNMAKIGLSFYGFWARKGDILISWVEYKFRSSVGTLEVYVRIRPDVSYFSGTVGETLSP